MHGYTQQIRMQTEGILLETENTKQRVYKTLRQTLKTIFITDGIAGLWLPGLLASTIREMTYSSLRMVI